MDQIATIRRMYYIESKEIKPIARELRISKNTVKKIIRTDITKQIYSRTHQPHRVLKEYIFILEEKLTHDKSEPKRRKRSAKKLYNEIRLMGYGGSYEAVNNFVQKWKQADGHRKTKTVYVPLSFDPGEAFQFDWSTEEIELAGVITRIKVAHIRLSYSRFFLVRAYPNEQLEMVMDAHNKAFEFFGGVCCKGIYDNMKTAIQKVLVGKDRIFNQRFAQMASHYLFEPIACTPAAGWEKGQVENQVSTSRGNFFTPLCKVSSLDELNQILEQQCLDWAKTHKHPEVKDKMVWEMYQEEQTCLNSYRKQFESFKVINSTVSSYSLINFDSNQYSVDCDYVREPVEIRVYPDRISICHQEKVIGEHARCFLKQQRIYNPWHYVAALERKPGALRNGAPFKLLELPAAVSEMQRLFQTHYNGDKSFIKLLLKAREIGVEALEKSCRAALDRGISNHEWIIERMMKPKQENAVTNASRQSEEAIKNEHALKLTFTPNTDCACYKQLLTKGVAYVA